MWKHIPSDPDLLDEWLRHQREPAFHALVSRYAGLVHATARRTCGDESLAAEATQLTFILLARKADSLSHCTSLAGWLHRVAILQTKNLIRQAHRENRKRQKFAMETPSHSHDDSWREMQPVLDDALAALSEKDREALLLRFYRSLSIREVAATLGIATEAAQKRITRATERLRGKLLRRGCQSGGTLTATLLAGFSADAQAALPVSVLTSKAIAAGPVGYGSFSTIAILMTASKSSLPLVIVLAGLLVWVGTQRKSIASLNHEIAALHSGTAEFESHVVSTTPAAREIPRTVKVFHADQPIDWKEVADYYDDPNRDPQWLTKLQEKLNSMSPEELISEMDKIAALYSYHAPMGQLVLRPLIKKDPGLHLKHLFDRVEGMKGAHALLLFDALREWAKRDATAAVAWFDEQAVAGAFEEKSLGSRQLLDRYHAQIIGVLISQDLDAAAARFNMIPETSRNDFISIHIYTWSEVISDYPAYASIIREMMAEKDRIRHIAAFAENIAFEKVGDYLDAIEATPAERVESAGRAAEMRVENLSVAEAITRSGIDAIREWADKVAPHAVGEVTGAALARSTHINTALTFDEAARLALEYHAETQDDGVLVGFLNSYAGYSNRAAGRVIAESIIDPVRRKNLQYNAPIR